MTTQADRVFVTFSIATHNWLVEHQVAEGHSTLSKFVASIVDQYVKSRTPVEDEPEPKPMTAEEQVAKIVEDIGNLTATYDEKFEAIRSLVPKDAPEMETLDDVDARIVFIWTRIVEENGFVRGERNKVVQLSRVDLKSYKQLCELQFKKLELLKAMSVAAVAET